MDIRVLELCLSPNKGGLELYFANICNVLGESMHVLAVVAQGSKLKPLIHINTIELSKSIHYLPFLAAQKLANIIDKHDIDVIHLHWNKDLTLAVLAKRLSKRKPKLIITRHMQFPALKNSIFHRFLYKNVNQIIAITQSMSDDFHRYLAADIRPKVSVNYLGIETSSGCPDRDVQKLRTLYNPENKFFLIVLVGRIEKVKGQRLLVDALALSKRKGLPFKVLIAGHPTQDTYLQALKGHVAELGLSESVVFLGFVDEPRCLMQACDVLVLPTVEETFGLVLIEAMSVGTPVIGSNRGGVPEIIEDKQSGLLFESCDSQSLFKALEYLYLNPKQAEAFSEAAKLKVKEKFSADKHVQTLVKTLKEVAND